MQAKDIITREFVAVASGTTIEEAAQRMRDLNVGMVCVTRGAALLGVLTDRDIVVRAVAEGKAPAATTVDEVMVREILSCYEDQDAEEAEQLMRVHHVFRLIVLDREGGPVGIVSFLDPME